MVSMSSWALVCGFVSIGSALRTESIVTKKPFKGPELKTVGSVRYYISSLKQNDNIDSQTWACHGLGLVGTERGFEEAGVHGGLKLPTWYLEEGYADIAAQTLLGILNRSESEDVVFKAAKTCADLLAEMNIQDDAEKCDALSRNSPHMWDAIVSYLRRFGKKDPNYSLFGLYGKCDGLDEVTEDLDRAGGFDYLLGALDHNDTGTASSTTASTALSYLSQSSKHAAKLVLKRDGVKYLMDALRKAHATKPSGDKEDASSYGPRHLALENIEGLMKHDDDKAIAKAFLKAGFVEDGLGIMADDVHDNELQQAACKALISFANRSSSIQKRLYKSPAWHNVEVANENCGKCIGKVDWRGHFHCEDCDRCTALFRQQGMKAH